MLTTLFDLVQVGPVIAAAFLSHALEAMEAATVVLAAYKREQGIS